MKKMLCMLLCVLMLPVYALAEDSAAGALTLQELNQWAASYIARAMTEEPLNNPAADKTADGYAFIYNFATLYADVPEMAADTAVNAVVVTSMEEEALRGVNVGSDLYDVLDAYYNENDDLAGSSASAVLYTSDNLPESASWAQVVRDGQRVQTIQYAVHEQLPSGGEGYSDAGVIYTMAENRVSAVRVYGLSSRLSQADVSGMMFTVLTDALENTYAMVPYSHNGEELTVFAEEDLTFSQVELLALTPDKAIEAFGEPMSDQWVDNGDNGYIRKQVFQQCEVTWLFNEERTQGSLYMLYIAADGLEGPRAVRIGDTFSSVYSRFRNGEGAYQEDGTEQLYGENGVGSFGKATYGADASATIRYGFDAADGRKVSLHMEFTLMELAEIMITVE